MPAGTIKATVLIETLPAAFEMDEILYELGQHSAGLNCGRWDYIFSFIKTNRADPAYVMPDRCSMINMGLKGRRSYFKLKARVQPTIARVFQVLHRRVRIGLMRFSQSAT